MDVLDIDLVDRIGAFGFVVGSSGNFAISHQQRLNVKKKKLDGMMNNKAPSVSSFSKEFSLLMNRAGNTCSECYKGGEGQMTIFIAQPHGGLTLIPKRVTKS